MAAFTTFGHPTPALIPLRKMITAERPTSLPLPDVVGSTISGGVFSDRTGPGVPVAVFP